MWPIHFIAVLPAPTVSSMSHAAHMLPGSHLQVTFDFEAISLPSGPMCVPVPVPPLTSGLMASWSGPGFGGVIARPPAGAAVPPDGAAVVPDGAGAAVLPDGAGAYATPNVQSVTA